ncbi:unnamed protein product [Microthlaspi erraticum]|uniref:Uncharacterized protein n=1 Tax=Microthlaspi erraticum TaxID=1685480 RepID=A0A6D2ITY3_9BRAS|nr:unnamed protein product [Microthlaspi erraticum]
MNDEERGRNFGIRTVISVMPCLVHAIIYPYLRAYEKSPSKPFSGAFAHAAVAYAFLQLLNAFARARNPRSMLFDVISVPCNFAVILIAFAAIFSN